MENGNIYALMVGVGDYEKMNIENLSTYKMDLRLLEHALIFGLKMPGDHIRSMSGQDDSGYITIVDFARAMAGFQSLLRKEDTFIFYFSGHGRDKNLIFSNGQIGLQSIINYIDKLSAKNKIVILDCCYSGDFKTTGARLLRFEDSLLDFVGRGIAVLASSSENEVARLDPKGKYSIFTGALAASIAFNKRMKRGRLALTDIYAETQRMIQIWNSQNPGKEQSPIFRSSMGGTIYFDVQEYHPYIQKDLQYETDNYCVVKVKPMSTADTKRLCVFVVLKDEVSLFDLAMYTKEIVKKMKYAEIYSSQISENRFRKTPAKVVWCYFGKEKNDIGNHLHWAYTIWVANKKLKKIYFKKNKESIEISDIYIWKNSSYDLVKRIQTPTADREAIIEENKSLLSVMITFAEQFIVDMQEVANHTISVEHM